jgi:peptide chain release factor 1
MFEKLEHVELRYMDLEKQLSDPDIVSHQKKYVQVSKEHADLGKVVNVFRELKSAILQIEDNTELLEDDDPEMREMAQIEIAELKQRQETLTSDIKILLLPKDPLDEKNILLEIRAGTGGEEAALFAADLFRMYTRFAEIHKWTIKILNMNETGIGGMKEVICSIAGKSVYSRLKYESGTHRVQRVPTTETSGRIHTSAVTVAILPEAEAVEIDIKDEDIRVDVYRSSGPGGQSVNTTDSAVRITHIETGIVVTCQDEKSQHKNKAKAMLIMNARVLARERAEQHAKIAAERKSQVGTGDRSGRIRTYNFPQGRITDHRIGFTQYKLEQYLSGELDEMIDALATYYQTEALKNVDS